MNKSIGYIALSLLFLTRDLDEPQTPLIKISQLLMQILFIVITLKRKLNIQILQISNSKGYDFSTIFLWIEKVPF